MFSRLNTQIKYFFKNSEWMIQTGKWVQLQENTNDFSRVSQERTPTTTRSPSPANSSSSSTVSKSTITGSRLIKLSLFPENKSQILDELEKEKKSTLAKRYSSVKKARSQFSLTGGQVKSQQSEDTSYEDTYANSNVNSGSATPTISSTSRSSSANRAPSADTSVHSPSHSLHKDQNAQTHFHYNNTSPTSSISNTNQMKPPSTPIVDPNSSIYSTTVKAISSMFKFSSTAIPNNDMNNDDNTHGITNTIVFLSTSPSAKSIKSLKFNERTTHQMSTTKSTPNMMSSNVESSVAGTNLNRLMLPIKDETNDQDNDDLASVTSSEFEKSSSVGGISLSLFRAKSSVEVTPNPSISSKTLNNNNLTQDDLSQVSYEKKYLYKKKEKSKSPISLLPHQHDNNNDSDTDMVDMDHIFAKERARQSIKQVKKEMTPPLANNSMSTQALDRHISNDIDKYSSANRNGGIMGKSFVSEQNVNRSRATSSPAHHNLNELNGGESFSKDETDEYERKYLRQEKDKNVSKKDEYASGGSSINYSGKEKGSMPFLSSLKRHAKSRASLSTIFRAVRIFLFNGIDFYGI